MPSIPTMGRGCKSQPWKGSRAHNVSRISPSSGGLSTTHPEQDKSPHGTKTSATNSAAVIELTARCAPSDYVTEASFIPAQLHEVAHTQVG